MLLIRKTALLITLAVIIGSSIPAGAVPPLPGTYDPETLTFYETGEKIPLFYDEPGPLREPEAYRGVWNFPVVFIETQDVSHTFPVSDWEAQLFTVGTHPTGSMRDFYREISYGKFDIDGMAAGWVMADYDYEHYHQNNYGFNGGAAELAREAVMKVEAQFNPDWSQFDNDHDGKVDGVVVIHMGSGGEGGGQQDKIWSHVSSFDALHYDGVTISKYSIQPEIRANGELETIGTICHEHGHVLGLPDLYDINYTTKPAPIGKYCLMAEGSSGGNPRGSIPGHMSAWCRSQVGWITPTEITSAGTYTIDDVHTHSTNCSYSISIPESKESFFITNRWMDADIHFAGLPARFKGGLLIYHVDDNYSFSNDGRNDFWHVIIEDGTPGDNYDLANAGFGAPDPDSFGRFTDPNTDGNYHASGITISNISAMAESMTFDVAFSPVILLRDYNLIPLGGNRFSLSVTVENVTDYPADNLNLNVATTAGNVSFTTDQVVLGSLAGHEKTTQSTPFVFETTDDISDFATFTIVASGPSFQGKDIPFTIPVNPARILLVDDDHTKGADADLDQYWQEGLDQTGISYQVWTTWKNEYPWTGMLNVFDLVIWCDGKGTSAVPKADGALAIIEDYLDSGGDLLWSSQEFLFAQYGMGPDDQDHILTEEGDFAREYLHILELEHDEYFYHATGVAGTITDGMNLELIDVVSEDPTGETGTFYWWPDEFVTDGSCIPILKAGNHEWPYANDAPESWTDDQADNALINETCAMLYQGQHRIMFMSASFHGITTNSAASPNTRQEFLSRVLAWFGITPSEPGLDIDVNSPMLLAGDPCHVTLKLFNPGAARSVNTFIAMEVYGQWLFGPGWTEDVTPYPMDLLASNTMTVDVFPVFDWPAGVGAGTITMWSVMVDADTGAMLGNYDFTPLSWM